MRISPQHKLWQTISECDDLPEEITDDIRRGFELHERAFDLWQSKRNTLQQVSNELNETKRHAMPKLFAEVSAGKKNTLTQSINQIRLLTQAVEEAQLAEQFTSQVMRKTESNISSPLEKFRDQFISWVAKRRSIEPFACGFTKHITPEVAEVWRNLSVQMYPRFDENLELPEMNKLPLIYDEGWTQNSRSGMAWIWQQIAQGNFDYVPKPFDKQGTSRTLRITAFANNIPQAPAIPKKPFSPFG